MLSNSEKKLLFGISLMSHIFLCTALASTFDALVEQTVSSVLLWVFVFTLLIGKLVLIPVNFHNYCIILSAAAVDTVTVIALVVLSWLSTDQLLWFQRIAAFLLLPSFGIMLYGGMSIVWSWAISHVGALLARIGRMMKSSEETEEANTEDGDGEEGEGSEGESSDIGDEVPE